MHPSLNNKPHAAGQTSVPTEFTDLYPTLCELAGLDRPEGPTGQSLVKLLNGQDDPLNKYAFSQYTRGDQMGYAIRDGRYRYVEWMETGRHADPAASFEVADIQLFDYVEDPLEKVNVAGQEAYSGAEALLKDALHNWLDRLDYKGS